MLVFKITYNNGVIDKDIIEHKATVKYDLKYLINIFPTFIPKYKELSKKVIFVAIVPPYKSNNYKERFEGLLKTSGYELLFPINLDDDYNKEALLTTPYNINRIDLKIINSNSKITTNHTDLLELLDEIKINEIGYHCDEKLRYIPVAKDNGGRVLGITDKDIIDLNLKAGDVYIYNNHTDKYYAPRGSNYIKKDVLCPHCQRPMTPIVKGDVGYYNCSNKDMCHGDWVHLINSYIRLEGTPELLNIFINHYADDPQVFFNDVLSNLENKISWSENFKTNAYGLSLLMRTDINNIKDSIKNTRKYLNSGKSIYKESFFNIVERLFNE